MVHDQSAEAPLTSTVTADENVQGRKAMTHTILTMMSAALLVFTIPIVLGTLTGAFDVESVLIILLLDVPTVGCWWLSRPSPTPGTNPTPKTKPS